MFNLSAKMVNTIKIDDPIIGHPPHYLHELPAEDEERLEKLFKSLDLDGNGKIDIHDLSIALKEFGVHHRYAQVRVIVITFRKCRLWFLYPGS